MCKRTYNSVWSGACGALILSMLPALAVTPPPRLPKGRLDTPVSAPPAPAQVADNALPPSTDFSRYAVILDRKPFGDEAAAAAIAAASAAAVAQAAVESFAKNIKMCAVTRDRNNGKIQVGLMNVATKKTYFLYEGDSEDGIELVRADFENEKALLKKGAEEVWVDLSSGPVVAAAPAVKPAGGVPSSGLRRGSPGVPVPAPAASVPAPATPAPKSAFKTPEALEKHLKEYQMELIRAGGRKGPPLPMKLTPEMDEQLVSEGVLPPEE